MKTAGSAKLREWYTRGVDALITETGLASRVGHVISDDDWTTIWHRSTR